MAPRSFKNLVITVAGTFPGYKQADLKNIVESRGATFSPTVTDECTHLVTTQKEVDKNGSKFKQASKVPKCNIVSVDWLLQSYDAKRPLAEKDYLLGNASISGSSSGSASNSTKTKAKDDDEDDKDRDEDRDSSKKDDNNRSGRKRAYAEAQSQNGNADVDEDEATEEQSNKKMKDAQMAGSKSLRVEVDDICPLKLSHSVHIDDSGLIWDATLNQTNAANNNNKFYRIQILNNGTDYKTWTRWGRVGEDGQSALLGNGSISEAQAEFEKKFKDKSGLKWSNRLEPPKKGKYTFVEKNYEEDSDDNDEDGDVKDAGKEKERNGEKKNEVESVLPKSIQNLMAFIFNQQYFMSTMASMSYDVNKLPLGKLSKRTLYSGYQILKDLAELIRDPTLANTKYGSPYNGVIQDLSNSYFTIIPHDFGRCRPPVLDNDDMIKKEIDLLEALSDMGVADDIMKQSKATEMVHQLDRQFQILGMKEMTRVDHGSTEFMELVKYLEHTRGQTHDVGYNVINIFRIERQGETDRFMASGYGKLKKQNSDRRLLWHGSRSTNYGGILSQGLRIAPPEAPATGYMFDKGVYFADMSSKSANYCRANISANMGLLLLCDVELGNPMLEMDQGNYNAAEDAKAQGRHSTLGRGRIAPPVWKDAGCVHPGLKGVKMPDVTTPPGEPPSRSSTSLIYNEYIAYDIAQIRQKYLLFVHMR